jgi:hypothetical protein
MTFHSRTQSDAVSDHCAAASKRTWHARLSIVYGDASFFVGDVHFEGSLVTYLVSEDGKTAWQNFYLDCCPS